MARGSRNRPLGKTQPPVAEPQRPTPVVPVTPARERKYWRIALASTVLLASALAFAWVEFYKGPSVTPVLRSLSILSNCTNEEGIVALLIKPGPVAELDIGLKGPVACSDIQFTVPTVVGDILSPVPGGRQHIPDAAMIVRPDPFNGTSIEIFPDKLPKPSGYISFPTILSRESFDTYSILLPLRLGATDTKLHSPKSMNFSALINGDFEIATVRPTSASVREQIKGEHLVSLTVSKDEEVYLELQSTHLRGIKNVVQWTAAAFFAASVAYLLGVLGLRF